MVNKTPLRLVAVEERPPEEDEQSAAPVRMTPENEAITRKVPNSAAIAAHEVVVPKAARLAGTRRLWPVVMVGVVIVGATGAAFVMKGRNKPEPAPVSPAATPSQVVPAPVQAPAAVAAPTPAPGKVVPETIRLQVSAEPVEAELSLDGNVLAGHRLNLEVPKDRGIHVVSASAPGYIPFNQQVSFSNDVVLNINLRRGRSAPVRQVVRARPSHAEARPQAGTKSAPGQTGSGMEPGMDLEGPAVRPNAKPIDERNPYKP